jgi:hypothetical protein
MSKVLYDTGKMSVGGNRGRITVTKTAKGVEVKRDSLYTDEPATIHFYKDGNYPALPADWQAPINDYMTTGADWWLENLRGYEIDKIVNPHARALGGRGGASTTEAKRRASRENGRKGGRPRKDKTAE